MSPRLIPVSCCVATTLALLGSVRAQTTTRATLATNGQQSDGDSGTGYLGSIGARKLSDDGRWLAFDTDATTLLAADANHHRDVYLLDRASATFELVSLNESGQLDSYECHGPAISADARYVTFGTLGKMVIADTNGGWDVYLRDRVAATTVCVSVDPNGVPVGTGSAGVASISADGRYVAFESWSPNVVFGDTNQATDVFVRDMLTGVTTLESVATGGAQATHSSGDAAISRDGRWVAFRSSSPNLVVGDTNLKTDVFLRDCVLGVTTRVSVDSSGAQADDSSFVSWISLDGRYVLFQSNSTNLVPGDVNGKGDAFLHDRVSGATTCVSVDLAGVPASGSAWQVSDDGRYASFTSSSASIVSGDANGWYDGFLRDLQLGQTERVTVVTGGFESALGGSAPVFTPDLGTLVFVSSAGDLVSGDDNQLSDIFVHHRNVLAPIGSYCTAKTNSAGCGSSIASTGIPSFSGYDAFFVTTSHVINNKVGVFIWSLQPAAIPFGGGTLCVAPPVVRTLPQVSGELAGGSSCSGSFAFHFRQSYMANHGLQPGTTVYSQFWSRDPGFAPPNNVGLSNALRFDLLP